MKDTIINTRIDHSVKEHLKSISDQSGKKISRINREAIEFYLKYRNDIPVENPTDLIDPDFQFLKSLRFTKLVHWIMFKKNERKSETSHTELNQHFLSIKTLIHNRYFPEEIKLEFIKIHEELVRFFNNADNYHVSFDFVSAYEGFDYQKFNTYMTDLQYSEDGIKTIYI